MGRLQTVFERLAGEGRKALIPYVTAGDPAPDTTVDLMHALARAGADTIELGVPFSDPMADGPVIQRAAERAVARGVTLAHCLQWVREFRGADAHTPVVLMGYANPVERYGADAFVRDAAAAGVDGVLIVDYPPEEAVDFAAALRANGLDPIFLLAPTSTEARVRQVAAVASGYVYYVSLKGVTGAGNLDTEGVCARVRELRRDLRVPLGVGFGIRDGASAVAVAACADAVIIGSRIIELMEGKAPDDALRAAGDFVADIRRALDAKAVTAA